MFWRRRKTREQDLERELRSDLELEAAEQEENGLSADEARYAAQRVFGNATLIQEKTREMWGWTFLERCGQDIRYGVRALRKSPSFACIAVVTLALAIGANTAIFSVIEAVLLRPLPYRDPSHLVLLTDAKDPDEGGILYRDFEVWKSQNRSFADMGVYYRDSGWSRVTLTGGNEPASVQGAFVSANFFSVLGVSPILGRSFTTGEEARRERVILLSHHLWVSRFGSSPDVVGQMLQVNGANFQIIGVMPASFQFPGADSAFWAPMSTNSYWSDPTLLITDPNHSPGFYARWQAIARLRPGVMQRAAQTEMNVIAAHLEQSNPDLARPSGIAVIPLHVKVAGKTRLALAVLFAAVCLVLLIACTNVSNLVLARGAARQRELSVRSALGAARTRILRQLFTENLILAIFSGCLGILLAPAAIRALIALAPPGIPRLQQTHVDTAVLFFTLAIASLSAIFFGLIPAWKASHSDPIESLKAGGRSASDSTRLRRIQKILVIAEFAFALILLAGAGLLVRSFLIVKAIDPGFRPEQVLTMHITPALHSSAGRTRFLDEMSLRRVRSLPGVVAVGAIDGLFSSDDIKDFGLRSIQGRPPEPRARWSPLAWTTVRGNYFQAMGARLLRGRFFSDGDTTNSSLVAIVNETVAGRYWPGDNPIGKRFKGFDKRGAHDDWLTVIGVVQDMRTNGLDRLPPGRIYQYYQQSNEPTPDLVVRTSGDPASLMNAVREAIRNLDETVVISKTSTVQQELADQLSPRRFETWLLSLFSAIALLLASIGIYGIIHYSASQRTAEIGIRMALGAMPREIQHLVVGEGLLLGAIGLALGIAGALALTRFLSNLLYGVTPSDPLTFISVSILLLGVAFLASLIPARRASRIDPLVALRDE
jgi:predicted permease